MARGRNWVIQQILGGLEHWLVDGDLHGAHTGSTIRKRGWRRARWGKRSEAEVIRARYEAWWRRTYPLSESVFRVIDVVDVTGEEW